MQFLQSLHFLDISVLQLQQNTPVMPVVEAPIYCLWPAAEITQNMPPAHSIANPIWFLISYYSNLAQIYCISTPTENPQPTNFIHDRFVTIKLQAKIAAKYGYYWRKAWRITRLDFEMFICFLAPGYVFREH